MKTLESPRQHKNPGHDTANSHKPRIPEQELRDLAANTEFGHHIDRTTTLGSLAGRLYFEFIADTSDIYFGVLELADHLPPRKKYRGTRFQ